MPRQPRWLQLADDAAYHVMSRGHNREVLFAEAADFRYFLGLVGGYLQRLEFRLTHYCLMSNHFHLLVQFLAGHAASAPGHLAR
jgi:REP element-mobilizing transposase RayT